MQILRGSPVSAGFTKLTFLFMFRKMKIYFVGTTRLKLMLLAPSFMGRCDLFFKMCLFIPKYKELGQMLC